LVIPFGSSPKEKKKRTGGSGGAGGLNKLCSLSPELQAVVGETELPRTQVVKLLWAYIRENGLQDPENRRNIICNDVLRILFNTDSTDMFKMNKLLSKHIWPLENGSNVGE
jgi:upstream activation factor subunit UAF30